MNMSGTSGIRHLERIPITDRQRFFHHDVYAASCALLDYRCVIERIREHKYSLRMSARNHVIQVREVQAAIESKPLGVTVEECSLRFRHAYHLDIGPVQGRPSRY